MADGLDITFDEERFCPVLFFAQVCFSKVQMMIIDEFVAKRVRVGETW